jgi:hypothetical protein
MTTQIQHNLGFCIIRGWDRFLKGKFSAGAIASGIQQDLLIVIEKLSMAV